LPNSQIETALEQLGPLESRIMRVVWEGRVRERFVVRSVLTLMPELAYTTIMTTLNRLAEKGILRVTSVTGQRAHVYQAAMDPAGFLVWASRRDADHMVERYGDLALAAFADRIDQLSPVQRERLRRLVES
jgi:predicted transcriptional regulator